VILAMGRTVEDTAVIMLTGAVANAGLPSGLTAKFEALSFRIYYTAAQYADQDELAGLVLLGITSALSMIGASYLSGALTDTRYLLEFDIFRGIKLTFVLPMLLVAVAFMQRFDIFDGQFDASAGGSGQTKQVCVSSASTLT